MGGSVAERLERWNCNPEAPGLITAQTARAGFVHGNPEFKSSASLVNSQLVCLWPVRILNPPGQNENYWFYSNCFTPVVYLKLFYLFLSVCR